MDFKSIFGGESLTLEQFNEKTKGMKLADLSGGGYVDKGKFEEQKAELDRLKNGLSERDATIKRLEEASGDAEAVRSWNGTSRKRLTGRRRRKRPKPTASLPRRRSKPWTARNSSTNSPGITLLRS